MGLEFADLGGVIIQPNILRTSTSGSERTSSVKACACYSGTACHFVAGPFSLVFTRSLSSSLGQGGRRDGAAWLRKLEPPAPGMLFVQESRDPEVSWLPELRRGEPVTCHWESASSRWGTALAGMYGDFLYDPAWFCFWQPWYPAWERSIFGMRRGATTLPSASMCPTSATGCAAVNSISGWPAWPIRPMRANGRTFDRLPGPRSRFPEEEQGV